MRMVKGQIMPMQLISNLRAAYPKKYGIFKTHLRHCLLYEFQLGHTSAEAHRNLVHVFSQDTSCARDNWMDRFKVGDFSLSEQPKSGRETMVDSDSLLAAIKTDPLQSTRDLATTFSSSV